MSDHSSGHPIAVQLYTLRMLPGGLDATLAHVAAAGYTAVETVGDHGLGAEELGELMARHGLQVISSHVALDALRERLGEVIAFNRALGNTTLAAPYISALHAATNAEPYREYGRLLGDLARRCRDEGVQLLYHNHSWELQEFDGQLAIDVLFDSAGPELGFEPDLAWIANGGQDPAALLARYAGRCPRVHFKDLAPKGERPEEHGLADVGSGILDWRRLLPAAREAGAEWYIVEHDHPGDPVASITRSIQYLQGL
jgi:sugar phosphate isomerase/epimerase